MNAQSEKYEFPVIETDRLLLKQVTQDDFVDYYDAANHPEITEMHDGVDFPLDRNRVLKSINRIAIEEIDGKAFYRGIFLKETGEIIGAVYLVNFNKPHRSAELAYWLRPEEHHRGYMTEAAVAIVDFGFEHLDLHRIWGMCYDKNPGSAKVLENVGMRKEGIGRGEFIKDGVWQDLHHYAILKSDWDADRSGQNRTTLETDRLLFRPLERADAEQICSVFDHPEYHELTTHIGQPYTIENAKAFIRKTTNLWRERKAFFFAVIEKSSGKIIGEAHIHWIGWEDLLAEFGMGLDPAHWNNGYGREAAKKLTRFAFEDLGMRRLFAMTMAINEKSRKLVEKLGWEFECVAREEWKQRDKWVDFAHYSLLKSDWEASMKSGDQR